MKRSSLSLFLFFFLLSSFVSVSYHANVLADLRDVTITEQQRDTTTVRNRNVALCDPITPPRERFGETNDCPPTTIPTNPPSQPTATPTGTKTVTATPTPTPPGRGGDGGPTSTPGPSESSSNPPSSSGGGSGPTSTPAPSVPVVGLSKTSSGSFGVFDIMLQAGVLCLLLYIKSKLSHGGKELGQSGK